MPGSRYRFGEPDATPVISVLIVLMGRLSEDASENPLLLRFGGLGRNATPLLGGYGRCSLRLGGLDVLCHFAPTIRQREPLLQRSDQHVSFSHTFAQAVN